MLQTKNILCFLGYPPSPVVTSTRGPQSSASSPCKQPRRGCKWPIRDHVTGASWHGPMCANEVAPEPAGGVWLLGRPPSSLSAEAKGSV